ncbi:class I adenylate-forming enzyme family protein [Paraglaciecola sp. 20A4]|uniref:class I adenylate-forming enzyme family protein n=1 Tax=Paraglaciecola sp. 20A4 TaxID=2687288 RepID=UPI00140756BF|nr:class I adenylate-forming enzyme family protein [Paraglaciecola sp. 20A4]
MNTTNKTKPWQFIYDEAGIVEKIPEIIPFSVHISRHAMERPNSPALCYLSKKISYVQLDAEANQLANALVALGISKGDVVGIQMPNIPQYVVAMLAVAKMGAIVSNVSPLLAPPELVYQIKDANISTLIVLDAFVPITQAVSGQLQGTLHNVIVTGAVDAIKIPEDTKAPVIEGIQAYHYTHLISDKDTQFEQISVSPDDVALIQYTGGTTGKPKGAMLTHSGLAWVNENSYMYANMVAGEDVSASPFPLFHIAGASGAMAILQFGCMSVLIPDPRDIDHFVAQLIANPPTIFAAVPTLYQMLLANPKSKEIDFSKLKFAVSGAAPLTGNDRMKVEGMLGEQKLADFFGMTETSPTYVANPPRRSKPTTVGIPLPGVDVKIMDLETGTKELPFGEEGEIVVNTPGLMKGYLNLPEETEKALRLINGKPYMYTGDVGTMDHEGYITVCDRAKDMLVVGGYKVFSLEVEDKLMHLDFIEAVAVVGTPDEKRPGNDVVNLFVQLNPACVDKDTTELEKEIVAFCRANMSPYKVPKRLFFVDQLSVTAVGKLDKKVMREMASV